MRLYALLGGAGSGKSCVARMLSELGAHAVIADDLAKEVYATRAGVMEKVKKFFFVNNPKNLSELVFADSRARKVLNHITHREINRLALQYFQKFPTEAIVIHERPIIKATSSILDCAGKESLKMRSHTRWHSATPFPEYLGVIFVHADLETRTQRLIERNGLSRIRALQIIHSQTSFLPPHLFDLSKEKTLLHKQENCPSNITYDDLRKECKMLQKVTQESAMHKASDVAIANRNRGNKPQEGATPNVFFIDNTGDFSYLQKQVLPLWQRIKADA